MTDNITRRIRPSRSEMAFWQLYIGVCAQGGAWFMLYLASSTLGWRSVFTGEYDALILILMSVLLFGFSAIMLKLFFKACVGTSLMRNEFKK